MPFSSIHFHFSEPFSQAISLVLSLPRFFINRYTFNDRIIEIVCERIEVHFADSSLFVYPTLTRSDYHTFDDSPWNKPFFEMIWLYLLAFTLWFLSQVSRFTGIYLSRPPTYQEKLNHRELKAWGLTIIIWISVALMLILLYIDDPQLYDMIGYPVLQWMDRAAAPLGTCRKVAIDSIWSQLSSLWLGASVVPG